MQLLNQVHEQHKKVHTIRITQHTLKRKTQSRRHIQEEKKKHIKKRKTNNNVYANSTKKQKYIRANPNK
jgi:hypothetical protein